MTPDYKASAEKFAPRERLEFSVVAEDVRFDGASDRTFVEIGEQRFRLL